MADWKVQPDGNVYLPMLKGWSTAGMGLHVGLQLRTGPTPKESPQPELFEVGMTPIQARKLSQMLLEAADNLDSKPIGSKQ